MEKRPLDTEILKLLDKCVPSRSPQTFMSDDGDARLSVLPKLDNKEIGIWSGKRIIHVYRSDKGFELDECPRCEAKIGPMYIGLIYASDDQLRQHMSPCAYICNDCETAVLDESLPRQFSSEGGYSYKAPISIYSLENEPPKSYEMNVFETYEGNEKLLLFSEDGFIEDVLYKKDFRYFETERMIRKSSSERKKIKSKRKNQKTSRKRNRK